MRCLIDTRTLIWMIKDSRELSKRVRAVFNNLDSELFVSNISFWEIAIKHSIGKVILHNMTPDMMPDLADEMGLQVAAVSSDVYASSYRLPFADGHRDPFDRLIIWQAISDDYILLSKDSWFTGYIPYGLKLYW
jgi:PIN domain nuclease of toxin-antitoxin system